MITLCSLRGCLLVHYVACMPCNTCKRSVQSATPYNRWEFGWLCGMQHNRCWQQHARKVVHTQSRSCKEAIMQLASPCRALYCSKTLDVINLRQLSVGRSSKSHSVTPLCCDSASSHQCQAKPKPIQVTFKVFSLIWDQAWLRPTPASPRLALLSTSRISSLSCNARGNAKLAGPAAATQPSVL